MDSNTLSYLRRKVERAGEIERQIAALRDGIRLARENSLHLQFYDGCVAAGWCAVFSDLTAEVGKPIAEAIKSAAIDEANGCIEKLKAEMAAL